MVDQNIFVCTEPQIGCAGTRVNGQPALPAVPVPGFKCIGQIDNQTNTTVVWTVTGQGNNEGYYGIAFAPDESFGPYIAAVFDATGQWHLLLPNSVSQFDSGFSTMNHVCFIYYNGIWTSYRPKFPLSIDPIISAVPCACDFTLLCNGDGVTMDREEPAYEIVVNNVLPFCEAGYVQDIPQGTPSFTLNASLSMDPDASPFPFTFRWAILQTPYSPSPPPFTINATALVQEVNATGLVQGLYSFVLWVSDLQAQVPCVFNLTISANALFAITEPDFEALFTFYAGNDVLHPCSAYPPQPSIAVNGSYSYNTLGVPMIYYWTQTDGGPLAFLCDPSGFDATRAIFNTSEPILQFVPYVPGQYCFQLIVSDNITNSTPAYVCVQVFTDLGQPPSSQTPINNYTEPPLVYLTPPPVPNYPFPNTTLPPFNTFPPVSPAPTPNTTVPPMFPDLGPLSPTDKVATVIVMAWCFLILWASIWFISQFMEQNEYGFLDKKIYGGSFSRLWNY
jgi:hypothetical protein